MIPLLKARPHFEEAMKHKDNTKLNYPVRATKKAVSTSKKMQKNLYYTDKFRQKDKDYNAKLELWRLQNEKNPSLYQARIDSLNKNIKK